MMAAVLTIVLFAAPSEAVSRVHFVKAQKAFAQHEWRHALDEFAAASESAPEELPDLWFDIGQCHRNLGHPRLAAAAFERYLALKPDAADRERVRALIVTLGGRPPPVELAPALETPALTTPAPIAAVVVETPPVPAPPASTALPLVAAADAAPPPAKPHRRWKVWTGVAIGVAVVAVGVGLGVGLSTANGGGPTMAPSTPALGSAATFDTRGH